MVGSILRLLAITLGAVILAFFAVIFVRSLGRHQQYQTPPHAWFSEAQWTIVRPAPEAVCTSSPPKPEDIFEVPVRKSRAGEWVVPCNQQTETPVATALQNIKAQRILLNVQAGKIEDLDKLVDSLSPLDAHKQIAVLAKAQDVARDLRKRAPQWLFAADSASLLRLHVFESLYLEPAMDFWPDFVIASTNLEDGTSLNAREVDELHRRHKRVLWNQAESSTPAPFPVDGVLQN
jgi:hypothetical protein